MKKTSIFVLAGLLIVGAIGSAMVCAEDKTSVYVEYGSGSGGLEASVSGNTAYDYETSEFSQIVAGLDIPLNNWKIGLEYQTACDPEYCYDVFDQNMAVESTAAAVKLGYRVVNRDQLRLWITGSYLNNEIQLTGINNTGLIKLTTDAFLIGPEINYNLTDRLLLQGYLGYAVSGTQDNYTVLQGTMKCSDLTMLMYNVKLNYRLSERLALGVGYSSKEVESKLEKPNGINYDFDYTDTQNVVAVGVTYKF